MTYPAGGSGPGFTVLMNMGANAVDFTLPSGQWQRLIDTQQYFDTTDYLNGASLPLRSSQNISLTSPTVFDGYLDRPDLTGEAFATDGWYRTGDLATIDDDGSPRLGALDGEGADRHVRRVGRVAGRAVGAQLIRLR